MCKYFLPNIYHFSFSGPKQFIMASTRVEKPAPGARYWLKRGKNVLRNGFSWGYFGNWVIISPIVGSSKYSTLSDALAGK